MTGVPFIPIKLSTEISVSQLYTLYYFCFAEGYVFEGEDHNFWELVYVNSGELYVTAGQKQLTVSQGHIILHAPNEFHGFVATKENTSIFVTSFDCANMDLLRLGGRAIVLNVAERKLLASLCQEGELCFGPTLDSANCIQLKPLPSRPVASLQLIRMYMEQLFIMLLRDENAERINGPRRQFITDEADQDELMEEITHYMESHLDGTLNFQKIRNEFGMSASSLKNFFAAHVGIGAIEYYQRLRIEESRRLLRAGVMNITEISEHLGYSSIQVFSRQFKRLMHMSPTEYLKSIHYVPYDISTTSQQ